MSCIILIHSKWKLCHKSLLTLRVSLTLLFVELLFATLSFDYVETVENFFVIPWTLTDMSCLVFVFVSHSSVSPYPGEYQACQSHQNHAEKYILTFHYSVINRTNFAITQRLQKYSLQKQNSNLRNNWVENLEISTF